MSKEQILAAMSEIVDAAGDNALTDEQCTRYEELESQLKRAQKSEEIQKRNAAYNAVVTSALHVSPAKEDDTLERAFSDYLRTGKSNMDISDLAVRNQSVGTDSEGGYAVPTTLLNKMIDRRKAFGGIENVSEVMRTAKGETLNITTIDDTANSGVIAAEGTAPASGGADLVFGQKSIGAFTYVAPGAGELPLRVTRELLQDANFDVNAKVLDWLGRRIQRKQGAHFVTGAGTTEPFGVTTGTAATAFTSAAITYAELVDATHSIDPDYRSDDCVWGFNDSTLALVEKLVDGNGRPLLNSSADSISGKPGLRLLGYRVVVDQGFSTYTDGGTTKWGVFGDLRQGFLIRRVSNPVVVVDPYTRVNEREVQYSLHERADSVVVNPHAFRVLINAV